MKEGLARRLVARDESQESRAKKRDARSDK